MAQPIQCDFEGPTHLADVLITQLANGDTAGWCLEHYTLLARAVVEQADQQLDEQLVAAEARSDQDDAGTDQPDDQDDQAVLDRLTRYVDGPAAAQDAQDGQSDPELVSGPPVEPAVPPGPAGEPVEPESTAAAEVAPAAVAPTVVRRGTSASRRKHEAKRRARAQVTESADDPT